MWDKINIHYSVFAITCFYIAIPLYSVQSLQILIFLQQISRIATILSCPYFFLAYFKVSELPTHAIGDGMDFGSQLLLYLYIKLIIAYIQSLVAMLTEHSTNCQLIIFYLFFYSDKFSVQLLCS